MYHRNDEKQILCHAHLEFIFNIKIKYIEW